LGRGLEKKKKVFIFSFKTSFPIILSNQILKYQSQCARESGAKGRETLDRSKLNQLSSLIIKAAIKVHKELARPPRLSEPKLR
jgi:hypothetical protein